MTAPGRSRRSGRRARRHLHVGSFSARRPRHGERRRRRACRRRARQASVSFDPNIRPFVTPGPRRRSRALVERQVALASFVKASEEDLAWLYPGRAVEEAAGLGGDGAAVLHRHARRRGRARLSRRRAAAIVAPRRRRRSSTPSAPATASCRRCCSRWTATARSAPARPPPTTDKLAAWTDFAARASAITCTRKGSNPPTLAEVEAAP